MMKYDMMHEECRMRDQLRRMRRDGMIKKNLRCLRIMCLEI